MTQIYENPNIYKLEIPLPENPLKYLNCYVIQDQGESLIIDTGFCLPECKEALWAGLEELQVDWNKTNLFLTHHHSDHSGLAALLMEDKPGSIIMSEEDHTSLLKYLGDAYFETYDKIFFKEGFTQEELGYLHKFNPATEYEPEGPFFAKYIKDGEEIKVGSYLFKAIATPGHTPGHTCLYYEKDKLLFCADHILFDITPNITFWVECPDSLGDYLNSLLKIRKVEVTTAFVGHRKNDMDIYIRIEEIIAHHYDRLIETLEGLAKFPYAHGTKIASCLKWSMRGKDWSEFPLPQRWFAVGEAIAHLDFLVTRGLVVKDDTQEQTQYSLAKDIQVVKEELDALWVIYKK